MPVYTNMLMIILYFKRAIPNILGTRDQFCGRQFFVFFFSQTPAGRGWFWDDHIHYIYCALYF